MKLEKAIEIYALDLAIPGSADPSDLATAHALGYEALKYHLYRRSVVDAVGSPLLPGETKE